MFVVAVILLLTQAAAPTSTETSSSSVNATHAINTQSHDKKTDTTPLVPSIDTAKTPGLNAHGETQGPDTKQQSVKVMEFPTLSIRRDRIDWGLWVFNALLVVVGASQAWFLWRTLQAIKRQANSAAKEVVLLNRAYLTVDNWMEHGAEEGIQFRIYNPSKTAARIEEIEYTIERRITTQRHGFMLTPKESQWIGIGHNELPEINVMGQAQGFHVRGRITYRDIFKKERHRTFARLCTRGLQGISFAVPENVGWNDEEEWNEE